VSPRFHDKPTGILVQKTTVSLPFELCDLTHSSWFERSTFLSQIVPRLDKGLIADVSGLEIVNCVLTAALPLHIKTTPILAEALAKLILFYPEALRAKMSTIIEFYLLAIRPPPLLFRENGKREFEDVLIAEAQPDSLITPALSIVLESQRPLEIERLIAKLYEKRPEIVIAWVTLRTLFCDLLRPQNKGKLQIN
jgi:hypothetical protein